MLNNLFYYVIYSSVVLVYGIGLDREILYTEKRKSLVLRSIKMLLCTTATTALSYLFTNGVLIPINLGELYPIFSVMIFISLSMLFEVLIRITAKISGVDFGLSLIFILLAVNECTSLPECVLNCCICILSFLMLIPFLYALCYRMKINGSQSETEKVCYILISMAVICIIMQFWNVSWLNKGVLL